MVKINYVLIDYENVQPADIALLDQEHFRVLIFVGASQTKISIDVASALQQMGARAEYIRISGNGSNALDFHIAFYVGHISAQSVDVYFHIISNDTGFDPLIQHLREKKIRVSRSKNIRHIPVIRALLATSLPEKIDVIYENLQQRGNARPRTVKTLSGTINALFQRQLTEEEVTRIIGELEKQKHITIIDTKINYNLVA